MRFFRADAGGVLCTPERMLVFETLRAEALAAELAATWAFRFSIAGVGKSSGFNLGIQTAA